MLPPVKRSYRQAGSGPVKPPPKPGSASAAEEARFRGYSRCAGADSRFSNGCQAASAPDLYGSEMKSFTKCSTQDFGVWIGWFVISPYAATFA